MPWVVEFDDAQCVASRIHGSAENPLLCLKRRRWGTYQCVIRRVGSEAEHLAADRTNAALGPLLHMGQKRRQQAVRNLPLKDSPPATILRIVPRGRRTVFVTHVALKYGFLRAT